MLAGYEGSGSYDGFIKAMKNDDGSWQTLNWFLLGGGGFAYMIYVQFEVEISLLFSFLSSPAFCCNQAMACDMGALHHLIGNV